MHVVKSEWIGAKAAHRRRIHVAIVGGDRLTMSKLGLQLTTRSIGDFREPLGIGLAPTVVLSDGYSADNPHPSSLILHPLIHRPSGQWNARPRAFRAIQQPQAVQRLPWRRSQVRQVCKRPRNSESSTSAQPSPTKATTDWKRFEAWAVSGGND
jgi:hypothetical protein